MVTRDGFHAADMQEMFAAVSELYARYWHEYFHFALFEGDETWDEAFGRTHDRYVRALRVADARQTLEMACGRGGFAEIMARNTSGKVTGIDISDTQLSRARQRVLPNLTFRRHDIMQVHELPETFDAVAFMDAACYLPDKALAIRRTAQVMRPGGRLLWIDWCRAEGLTPVQEELVLEPFMRYWAIPSLETGEAYEVHFRPYFHILEAEDLNHCTRRNWEYAYESAIRAIKELTLENLPGLVDKAASLGPECLRLIKEQFPAALYIRAGFDAGFLRYKYYLLERR
ncbi:MAG: class I SAM-dependent methyltransferase [Myxococcota bacterium]